MMYLVNQILIQLVDNISLVENFEIFCKDFIHAYSMSSRPCYCENS